MKKIRKYVRKILKESLDDFSPELVDAIARAKHRGVSRNDVNSVLLRGGSDDELALEVSRLRKTLRERFSSEDFRDVYATARMAHTGQKRRSGEDYFSHPSEVRNIVARFYPKDRVSQLAALLHDSLEDAPGSTVSSIEEMEEFIRGSISDPSAADEVIRVVRALTHEKGGDYLSYVVDLMGDQPALRVKLADMVHNLSSAPSPKQKAKYKSALDAISDKTNGSPPPGISQNHWDKLFLLTEDKSIKYLRSIIREAIALDLEVDDIILTGRFKNKRTVVKKIGIDDMGQPTVNGMKALSFRIEKLMPKSKWSKKSLEEEE